MQGFLDKLVSTEMDVQGNVDSIRPELKHCCNVKGTKKHCCNVKATETGKMVNSLHLKLQLRNKRRVFELETVEAAIVATSPLDEFPPFWTADESPYKLI